MLPKLIAKLKLFNFILHYTNLTHKKDIEQDN